MSTLQAYHLTKMLERVLAALETPGDLTSEEKQHVIEDGAACIEEWGCQEKPEIQENSISETAAAGDKRSEANDAHE